MVGLILNFKGRIKGFLTPYIEKCIEKYCNINLIIFDFYLKYLKITKFNKEFLLSSLDQINQELCIRQVGATRLLHLQGVLGDNTQALLRHLLH